MGEIIIRFDDECPDSVKLKIFSNYNAVTSRDMYKRLYDLLKNQESSDKKDLLLLEKDLGKNYVITISDKSRDAVLNTVEELNKEPYVKYAQPNYVYMPCVVPNADNSNLLWNMECINMPETWDCFSESNVKVGVLDSGIDYTHPDLCNNVNLELGYNCAIDSHAKADIMDYHGHGTHMAGIIGAEGNNSIGVIGVNPKVDLVPIKITANNISTSTEIVKQGIRYAKNNNIPICNFSYLNTGVVDDSLFETIKEYGKSGGLFITIAGNDGKCIDYSSEYYYKMSLLDNVIIVAASNNGAGDNEALCSFSNYGNLVDIAAPGYSICSTVPTSLDSSGYLSRSGTSVAAPHVAGVASLLKGKYPNMTPLEIKQAIIDGADFVPKIAGEVESSGRLNAFNAINRVPEESYLVVHPRTGESMAAAIRRSLGNRSACKITKLRISGTVEMGDNTTNSSNLTSNILPNLKYVDVSQYPYELKEEMFYDCQNLTTVILPNRKIKIPAYCFMYCSKLNTIYTAHSSSKIMNEVDLSNLINGANGDYATQTQCFQGCTSLKTVKLPNTNKIRIAQFTFNNCSKFNNLIH